MPLYDYICTLKHVTEQRGGYDDATIPCPKCKNIATRRPGYISQGVIFHGTGFTRTVIPPAPPKPTTKAGEPVNDWAEHTDEYVRKNYEDDKNYREERKQQAKDMLQQVDKGGIA